jgi:succinate-semialdehyde dehydrogenase/glutarate-semialdehyde dehydrogenase
LFEYIKLEGDFMKLNDNQLFRQQCFIKGVWIDAASGAKASVHNPADGQQIGTVPDAGAQETKTAIDAASRAWPGWKAKTALDRSDMLLKWYALAMEAREDLAVLLTTEQGKPLAEARGEIGFGASFFRWFAEEGRRAYGDVIPSPWPGKRIIVMREPVGVVGIITPWNFPMAMIARKAAAAMAAGCTVVIKPAPQTPYSALAMAELAQRAGIPAGVFNVVTGDAQAIGGELTSNPLVRKVSFTGSTATGKKLLSQCSGTVKKMSLELGGNAPFLIFDDSDIDLALQGVVASKFRNSGQTCICVNRIYVQDGICDQFTERLAAAVGSMKVGSGLEPGVVQGPLIDERAVQKVERHVADAIAKGGRVLTGGKRHQLGGTFFEPTVIAGATSDMTCACEETFGPFAPVFRFRTESEALSFANTTEMGLAAYVYTKDLGRAWRVSEALEYGMVGVNESIISTCEAPFGGIKESGFGREGSRYGLDDYSVMKYVCMAGLGM